MAGNLIRSGFDSKSKEFTGVFEAVPNGKTVLYVNREYNYPSGVNIEVYPSGLGIKVEEKETNFFEIRYEGSENLILMVKVTADFGVNQE